VAVKIAGFLDVAPRSLVDVYGSYCETSADIYQIARRHVLGDSNVRHHFVRVLLIFKGRMFELVTIP
jgi:hypothetical protein